MKVMNINQKQSSLIHQKIRNASFVETEENSKRFKYNLDFSIFKYINDKFIILKTTFNKIIQGSRLQLDKIDFNAIRNQGAIWLLEAFIEGLLINFIVWALIGWRFNWATILAWGIMIKQLLSIYWRFRNDGTTTTIPQK